MREGWHFGSADFENFGERGEGDDDAEDFDVGLRDIPGDSGDEDFEFFRDTLGDNIDRRKEGDNGGPSKFNIRMEKKWKLLYTITTVWQISYIFLLSPRLLGKG